MFGTILLSVTALMAAYVFWRMGSVPWLGSLHWSARTGLGLLAWLVVACGRTLGRSNAGFWAFGLETAGMALLVILFLSFLLLLAVDLITAWGWLLPNIAPLLRGLALTTALLLSGLALVQGLRAPVVTGYEVVMEGLPPELDGTVVAGMSDLHLGRQLDPDWLEARVAQVAALEPDMIVLLGDILEGRSDGLDQFLPAMRKLRAPLGTFAVLGNHDNHGRTEANQELLVRGGCAVLINRAESPTPGLVVAGIEDLTTHARRGKANNPLAEALAHRPDGATILLSHTPLRLPEAASYGVGLMLSGHTHGGQVWPFGLLLRLRYPLIEGEEKFGPMTAIVCRGTGLWGPRMRLWSPGEILKITLRSK
ncbi:MAG: metallophosphoesterase [Pseudodesulfovibrio sp.]|uniref:metallophosphoesterase n=1 Tax=Pseudodesulfovibrio sp. TaxID=2035812 RepID=UPI003D0DE05A